MEMVEERRKGWLFKDIAEKHGCSKATAIYLIKELEEKLGEVANG